MKQKFHFKTKAVVFRQWDNKRYAIFKSLKRTIVIACLMVGYLLHANPQVVMAQTDSLSVAKNYNLDEIDITSDALPETYSNISRVVVTITQKEIERAAVGSLNELLEYASNIDIRQRGTNGVQADISIRGGSFDQVLILLNGVNITDPQTGHHNLNLPFDFSAVERVEILKGPGAWKFGPGAFCGAINIITNTSNSSFVKANIEAGQFTTHAENLNVGIKYKKTSHLLSVHNSASGGYTDNTDYNIKSLYYCGNLLLNETELSLQAGGTTKSFGANSFYTAKYPSQYEETQTYFIALGAKTRFNKIQIDPKFYFRRNNDRYLLYREHPAWYENNHLTNVAGANVLIDYTHGTAGVSTLGFDVRNETIYSNNLGEETENTRVSPINDSIILNRNHSRTNLSMCLSHKHYFNKLTINLGANFTYNTDLDGKLFIYPGIDANYNISEVSSLFASLNKTMRMPTFTDLYYYGASNVGNPDLLPEEAVGYELGYKFDDNYLNVSLTSFYMHGTNMIDWVRETTDDVWTTANYTELNTAGVEFASKLNLNEIFDSQEFLQNLKINYTYIHQSKAESDLISYYTLNYLKHQVDMNLKHTIWRDISASWQFTFQDRNGQYEEIIDQYVEVGDGTVSVEKVSNGMVDYKPFFTADLKAYWNYNGWNVFTSINNIFNVEYYDFGNISQPGRWIKFGISKKIDF